MPMSIVGTKVIFLASNAARTLVTVSIDSRHSMSQFCYLCIMFSFDLPVINKFEKNQKCFL